MKHEIRNPKGVVLVLVSGFLALLFVLGAAFLRMAGLAAARPAAQSARAHLAAFSGMEYAAARLTRHSLPGYPGIAENRGDDWTYREGSGVSVEGSANPSYSHGEGWINDGDGIFDPAADTFPAAADRDGNGRFDAYSGRLRGGRSAGEVRFTLKVECSEGKLPLNAGILDPEDLYGGEAPPSSNWMPEVPNTIPDCRDPDIGYHRGLLHALNNLGVVVDVSARRADVATSGEPIQTSWLGFDLIANRPPGGYKDWTEVERTLKSVTSLNPAPHNGGSDYSQADCGRIRPFVDLGPHETLAEGGRPKGYVSNPPYAPVNLWSAPREVLQSLWMYTGTYIPRPSKLIVQIIPPCLPGESSAWGRQAPRTGGLRFADLTTSDLIDSADASTVLLFPDEAAALADALIRQRETGTLTWKSVYDKMHFDAFEDADGDLADDDGTSLFQRDFDALAGFPLAQQNWARAKAQLAYQAVTMDPYPFDRSCGSTHWALAWGAYYPVPPPAVSFHRIERVFCPGYFGDPDPFDGMSKPPFSALDGFSQSLTKPWQSALRPQGGTINDPVRFSVESLGAAGFSAALVWGRLRAAENLDLASQEDFENLQGWTRLRGRGITTPSIPSPPPEERRSFRKDPMGTQADPDDDRTYPAVASLPRWNRRSLPPDDGAPPEEHYGYSRLYGALTLAGREAYANKFALYWPFSEDFDGKLNDAPPPPDPPEFWALKGTLQAPGDWRFPVRTAPNGAKPADDPETNPFVVSGKGGVTLPCPGVSGGAIRKLMVEFWAVPGSVVDLLDPLDESNKIRLKLTRIVGDSMFEQSFLELTANWALQPQLTAGAPDDGPPQGHNVHAAMSIQENAGDTYFQLYINGEAKLPSPAKYIGALPTPLTNQVMLRLTRVDQVRLYEFDNFDDTTPAANYGLGRFAGPGLADAVYISPLYVFDEPARVLAAQWVGVEGMGSLNVTARGYDDATGLNAPIWSHPFVKACERADLSSLPRARSIRYEVRFNTVDAPYYDTPVFESISFKLARDSRRGWTSWGR